MANDLIPLYNFYKRYKWLAEDFEGWQAGMVDHSRGHFEGTFAGAVLQGFDASIPVTGFTLPVNAGIATGPTGYLHVINSQISLDVPAPTGTFPVKHLVVAQPNLIADTIITRPTNPFDVVPLRTLQATKLVVIEGTPSNTPIYPSAGVGDVVLFGINLAPGATGISQSDLDLEVRDVPGKHSDFQQHASKYDDRCRAYVSTSSAIGIKPSQTFGSRPKLFTYVAKGTPSKFPLDAGLKFNTSDTFVDFNSGIISGGDAATPDFTPVIPSAGNAILATVSLGTDNQLDIAYGTEGTKEQCYDAMINQTVVGAGAIALPRNHLRLAYVIVKSHNGSVVSDLEMFDARTTFYFGGVDPQEIITENASQESVVIEDGQTMFNPSYDIQPSHTAEVQSGGTLLSVDTLTVQPGGTLIVQPGGTARVI